MRNCIAQAIAAGVDWVQIREKDLSARRLLAIAEAAAAMRAAQGSTRVMVNDRFDVALAANAHGVHLGTRSMPVDRVRRLRRANSSLESPATPWRRRWRQKSAGADYILLGPIFATPSKLQYGPPLGLAKLREVTSQVSIPVFALGGITVDNAADCRENGAAGIAGIRLFQDAASMVELVRILRREFIANVVVGAVFRVFVTGLFSVCSQLREGKIPKH